LSAPYLNYSSEPYLSFSLAPVSQADSKGCAIHIAILVFNIEPAKKIAFAITEFAMLYSVDCIVFEYLDFRGMKAVGNKKQNLQMWRKNGIQNMVEHSAHRCGIPFCLNCRVFV
jgi:hypothetical protein